MKTKKILFKDTPGEIMFQRELAALLAGPRHQQPEDWKKIVKSWKQAFLAKGSETPCNLKCVRAVDYGPLSPEYYQAKDLQGLRIKGARIPLSSIASYIEGIRRPKRITKDFPELTLEQWDAFLRVVTMIFSALNHPQAAPRKRSAPPAASKKQVRKKPKA